MQFKLFKFKNMCSLKILWKSCCAICIIMFLSITIDACSSTLLHRRRGCSQSKCSNGNSNSSNESTEQVHHSDIIAADAVQVELDNSSNTMCATKQPSSNSSENISNNTESVSITLSHIEGNITFSDTEENGKIIIFASEKSTDGPTFHDLLKKKEIMRKIPNLPFSTDENIETSQYNYIVENIAHTDLPFDMFLAGEEDAITDFSTKLQDNGSYFIIPNADRVCQQKKTVSIKVFLEDKTKFGRIRYNKTNLNPHIIDVVSMNDSFHKCTVRELFKNAEFQKKLVSLFPKITLKNRLQAPAFTTDHPLCTLACAMDYFPSNVSHMSSQMSKEAKISMAKRQLKHSIQRSVLHNIRNYNCRLSRLFEYYKVAELVDNIETTDIDFFLDKLRDIVAQYLERVFVMRKKKLSKKNSEEVCHWTTKADIGLLDPLLYEFTSTSEPLSAMQEWLVSIRDESENEGDGRW